MCNTGSSSSFRIWSTLTGPVPSPTHSSPSHWASRGSTILYRLHLITATQQVKSWFYSLSLSLPPISKRSISKLCLRNPTPWPSSLSHIEVCWYLEREWKGWSLVAFWMLGPRVGTQKAPYLGLNNFTNRLGMGRGWEDRKGCLSSRAHSAILKVGIHSHLWIALHLHICSLPIYTRKTKPANQLLDLALWGSWWPVKRFW